MKTTVAAIAIAALFAGLVPPVLAQVKMPVSSANECVYEFPHITRNECLAFRARILKAKDSDERNALYRQIRTTSQTRAKQAKLVAHR